MTRPSSRRRSSAAQVAAILAQANQMGADDDDLRAPDSFTAEPAAAPAPPELATAPATAPQAVNPAAAGVAVEPPQPAPVDHPVVDVAGSELRRHPTGWAVPPKLHAKVHAVMRRLSTPEEKVQQTEVVLRAFEKATAEPGKLDAIIAEAMKPEQIESPLFGQRPISKSKAATNTVRLQVRPRWIDLLTLQKLADDRDIDLTKLVNIVLEWDLKDIRVTQPGRKAGSGGGDGSSAGDSEG